MASYRDVREQVVEAYNRLDSRDHTASNDIFHRYGAGNVGQLIFQPFERLYYYEEMLEDLRSVDPAKYRAMHKGTPFFFMAWLSFDLRNFEKALLYLDSAISEDVKNAPTTWRTLPGVQFLKLADAHNARRTSPELRQALESEMNRFNAISGLRSLTLADWAEFVEQMLDTPQQRTILCTLCVFFYEFRERMRELEIRDGINASNHPFYSHLFLGGLLFESLLKQFYQGDTLAPVLNAAKTDFGILPSVQLKTSAHGTTPFSDIHGSIAGNDVVTAFSITAQIRNTTGHNLNRDQIFDVPSRYSDLFQQVANALFYVVSRKYVAATTQTP